MDIVTVLRFVHDHNELVTGTLVALFLATCILLLIRMIGEKSQSDSADRGEAVDLRAIEGAMKKVLASQPVSVVAAPQAAAAPATNVAERDEDAGDEGFGASSAELERLQSEIAVRNELISNLEAELAAARSLAASARPAQAAGDDSALLAKIEDLEARLAEYSIIEDDIADLSLFKEENSKLKEEIAALREQVENAAQAPNPAPAPAPAPSKVKVENETNLKFEKADKFELDLNDDIMKEFAAAVEDRRAPTPVSAFSVPPEEIEKFLEGDKDPKVDLKPLAEEVVAGTAKTLTPEEEAQAKIDAMFASAAGEVETPAPDSAPKTLTPEDEAQASIDAMLANAEADLAALSAEPALEPAAEEPIVEEPDAVHAEQTQPEAVEPEEDLLGSLDTAKMLSEVETLGADMPEDDGDALAESLDTDKLLSEVNSLEPTAPPAAPPTALMMEPLHEPEPVATKVDLPDFTPPPAPAPKLEAKAEPEPIKAPAPPKPEPPKPQAKAAPAANMAIDRAPVDDLLAEFEDESKLGS